MENGKEFLTVDEQVTYLKNKGIKVPNPHHAKEVLQEHSYYTVINGYCEPFLAKKKPKTFKKDVSFYEILALYRFDRVIRHAFLRKLMDVEDRLKSIIVYEFSSSRKDDGSLVHVRGDYLKPSHYPCGNSTSSDPKNLANLKKLIKDLREIINRDPPECIKHYKKTYGFVPLWVLATDMTFGQIGRFYNQISEEEQIRISTRFSVKPNELSVMLRLLTLARNICAHSSRMYCSKYEWSLKTPDAKKHPRIFELWMKRPIRNQTLCFDILLCLKYFLLEEDFSALINEINAGFVALNTRVHSSRQHIIYNMMGLNEELLKELKK